MKSYFSPCAIFFCCIVVLVFKPAISKPQELLHSLNDKCETSGVVDNRDGISKTLNIRFPKVQPSRVSAE